MQNFLACFSIQPQKLSNGHICPYGGERVNIEVEDNTCKKSNTEVDNNPRQETNENEIVKKWDKIFSHVTINTDH